MSATRTTAIQRSTSRNENCTFVRQLDQSVSAPRARIAGNNAFAQDRYRKKLFAHSEQGKRRTIVAVFELKKEIPD
jgi:hypothetical protein